MAHCPLCHLEVKPEDPPHLSLKDCTEALAEAENLLEDSVRLVRVILQEKARDATAATAQAADRSRKR